MLRKLILPFMALAIGALMAFGIREVDAAEHEAELKIIRSDLGHGAGFHFRNGLILTAAHVVEGKHITINVVTRDGRVYEAKRLWQNDKYDVAAIRIEPVDMKTSKLDCAIPPVGTEVTAVGYPLNLPYLHHFGRVANNQPQKLSRWDKAIIVNATVGQGMSGSPVRRVKDNGVVGVVVGTWGKQSTFAITVPSYIVCEMLGQK